MYRKIKNSSQKTNNSDERLLRTVDELQTGGRTDQGLKPIPGKEA
jgi:hypothetical protein